MTRILCIDDSEDLRDFYLMVLETAGHSVILANDGVHGLALAKQIKPDLIITDISMPKMDGLELLERLRSDIAPPLPPVIVCSGFDMTASDAMRRGAARFVPKPVAGADLLAIVEATLRGRTPDINDIAAQRQKVDTARARASQAAARLLQGIDLDSPALVRRRTQTVNWVARYYGCGFAVLALVDGGHLRISAVSDGSPLHYGATFDGHSLYSMGVLATGSSLVLSDASSGSFADPRAVALGFRFIVAVPLVYDGVPIGALCIIDAEPHHFDAEDLLILERFGRDLSRAAMTGPHDPLFDPSTFERLLATELALLHRDGGNLDVAFVSLSGNHADRVCRALLELGKPGRIAVCRRADDEIALFARGQSPSVTLRELLTTIDEVAAIGWISIVDDALPSLSALEVLQDAADVLVRARQAGPIVRVVVQREPTQLRT